MSRIGPRARGNFSPSRATLLPFLFHSACQRGTSRSPRSDARTRENYSWPRGESPRRRAFWLLEEARSPSRESSPMRAGRQTAPECKSMTKQLRPVLQARSAAYSGEKRQSWSERSLFDQTLGCAQRRKPLQRTEARSKSCQPSHPLAFVAQGAACARQAPASSYRCPMGNKSRKGCPSLPICHANSPGVTRGANFAPHPRLRHPASPPVPMLVPVPALHPRPRLRLSPRLSAQKSLSITYQ